MKHINSGCIIRSAILVVWTKERLFLERFKNSTKNSTKNSAKNRKWLVYHLQNSQMCAFSDQAFVLKIRIEVTSNRSESRQSELKATNLKRPSAIQTALEKPASATQKRLAGLVYTPNIVHNSIKINSTLSRLSFAYRAVTHSAWSSIFPFGRQRPSDARPLRQEAEIIYE